MELLKLLLSIAIIIGIIATEDIYSIRRLPEFIKPMHYDITFNLYNPQLVIDFAVKLYILHETRYIAFHGPAPLIEDRKFCRRSVMNETELAQLIDVENKIHIPYKQIYKRKTEMYIILFSSELLRGEYNLRMKFTPDKHHYFFRYFNTTYIYQKNKISSVIYFQLTGARYLFPCWDEPQIKATFQISIIQDEKYTSNVTVLSNTLLENNYEFDSSQRLIFETTASIPVHLLAIAVIKDSIYLLEENIALVYRNKLPAYVINLARNVIKYITKYFESTYLKVIGRIHQHVIIPDYPDNIDDISSWGLILYKENAIIYDKSEDYIIRQIEVANLVARQVAYQWFGNIASPTDWSEVWLFKSLARLFGANAIYEAQIFEDRQMIHDIFIVQNQYESLHLDTRIYYSFIYNNFEFEIPFDVESFSSVPPYRATSIMHMWHHILTNEIFNLAMKRYLKLFARHSAISDDFWLIMESSLFIILNEKHISPDSFNVNIINIMKDWLTQWYNLEGDPMLIVSRIYNSPTTLLNMNMEFIEKGFNNITLPVTYTTQSDINFNRTSFNDVLWLQNGKLFSSYDSYSDLNISSDDWIIINLQQTGYYRVNYDKQNWQLITNYLLSDNYTKIHVLNRAKLIDDAYHFLKTRHVPPFHDPYMFWNLVVYLKKETSYIAWYPMIKALEEMSNIIPYLHVKSINYIKETIADIFSKLLEHITYDESSIENYLTKCLRQEAIKWLCTLGNKECKNIIHDKLRQHMKDPERYKLSPGWKQWTYRTGLSVHYLNLRDQVLDIYNKNPSKIELLEALACSENVTIIYNYLLSINTEHVLKIPDLNTRAYIFLYTISKHANNWDLINLIFYKTPRHFIPHGIETHVLLHCVINNARYDEIFAKILKFAEVDRPEIKNKVELKIKQRLEDISNYLLYKHWNFKV